MAPEAPPPAVDLRPLTTGELIDRGFALYRQNFAGLLLLALLSQAAMLIVQMVSTMFHLQPAMNEIASRAPDAFVRFGIYLFLVASAVLIAFLFDIVITVYVADAYLGELPSLKKSFRRLLGFLAGAVWTWSLKSVCYLVTLLFPVAAMVALNAWYVLAPPMTFPGLIGFLSATVVIVVLSLVPILIVFMRLMAAVPVIAMEGTTGWAACRRSSALVRFDPGLGFFYWGETRLSLLLLPLFVIQLLTSTLTSIPLIVSQVNDAVRHGTAAQLSTPSDVLVVGSQILTYLAGAVILPLYTIAITLFYYDVRIRREGFDLEFMAAGLENRA